MMLPSRWSVAVFVFAVTLAGCTQDQKALVAQQPLGGTITNGNQYQNLALGIRVLFEGSWQFLEKEDQQKLGITSQKSSVEPKCDGPLCVSDINISLITKPSPLPPFGTVFLLSYKLQPPYLERKRYPLSLFAKSMMAGSLQGSNLVPAGEMGPLTIDGQPAFRLLTHPTDSDAITTVGYVFESRGYMTLIVVSSPTSASTDKLRSAIEHMRFAKD